MVTTIRKPTDLGGNKIGKGGGSYMSPYSQKMATKSPNNWFGMPEWLSHKEEWDGN